MKHKINQNFSLTAEHEIKYISFGCPGSNDFRGFMSAPLLFVLGQCTLMHIAGLHAGSVSPEKLREASVSQSSDLNTSDGYGREGR